MKKNLISYLSNGMLLIGVMIGVYAFAKIYLVKSNLPAGVCPVTANKSLMVAAIILCAASLALSFFEPKTGRKETH